MIISEDLQKMTTEMEPHESVNVIVKTKEITRANIISVVNQPEHTIRQQIYRTQTVSLSIPAFRVLELAEEFWVERVEPDKKVYAVLDTSLPLIGVPQIWQTELSGKNVNVAVIDTGVDKYHPDLEGRIVATADFTLEGFRDLSGHGTHVSGIVCGGGKSLEGKYKGVAPQAQVIAAKVLRDNGTGRMSDVMAGIEWAIEQGADIVSLSLGTKGPSDGKDALSELCDAVVKEGKVVCVAAGNSGPERRTIGSPGCAREVITVGASTEKDRVAEFSSRGPSSDDRLKPDVVAPGVDIVSLRASKVSMGKPQDAHYTKATGSSMSCAHISGLAALLLEAKPDASPALFKEALLHTAKELEVDEYAQGAGRVEALAALDYIKIHENPPEIDEGKKAKGGCLNFLQNLLHLLQEKISGR